MFLSYFPHIVQGPIDRYNLFKSQLPIDKKLTEQLKEYDEERKVVEKTIEKLENELNNTDCAEELRFTPKDILLKLGENDPDTIKEAEKAPMAAVEELAESSVNMLLRVWAPTDRYWDTKFRLTEAVKAAFDEAGIEIPFNQLDVHLINS